MDVGFIFELGKDIAAGIALVSAGAGGIWAYRRRGKTTASEEWKDLAEVRGQTVDDLEDRVVALEQRIAYLEGAYTALQGLKATEIADEVVARLGRHEGRS